MITATEPRLTPSTRAVLEDLREHLTPEGFYVQTHAAKRLGVASRTVKRALDHLHRAGLVDYTPGDGPFPSRITFH